LTTVWCLLRLHLTAVYKGVSPVERLIHELPSFPLRCCTSCRQTSPCTGSDLTVLLSSILSLFSPADTVPATATGRALPSTSRPIMERPRPWIKLPSSARTIFTRVGSRLPVLLSSLYRREKSWGAGERVEERERGTCRRLGGLIFM
jgi:hypothetical protein